MFKKTILVAALGAISAGAYAADVELYGVVDTGLKYTHEKWQEKSAGSTPRRTSPSRWNRARIPPRASACAALKTLGTASRSASSSKTASRPTRAPSVKTASSAAKRP